VRGRRSAPRQISKPAPKSSCCRGNGGRSAPRPAPVHRSRSGRRIKK